MSCFRPEVRSPGTIWAVLCADDLPLFVPPNPCIKQQNLEDTQ